MSKPITRFAFSVLICLALLAGIYTSTHGLGSILQRADANNTKAGFFTSVRLNLNNNLPDYFGPQINPQNGGHDCNPDLPADPDG